MIENSQDFVAVGKTILLSELISVAFMYVVELN